MTNKLTLSADRDVVEKARRLAAQQNTSISALFGRFVHMASRDPQPSQPIGALTRKATAMIKLRRSGDERRVLEQALLEKYGLE